LERRTVAKTVDVLAAATAVP
jgi:hypothetical protein